MVTKRMTWTELKRQRADDPEVQAGYERSRRAYEIGEQVRALRQAKGLSQAALGELAGTSQQAIARIENGGVMPTIDSLDRIGQALGADLTVRFESKYAGAGGRHEQA
jgi:ribosome-binding protein aMBF1 (putative translation factor)